MEIKTIAGDIVKIETGAIIVNCFEDDKQMEGDIAAVDAALDGEISQLVKQAISRESSMKLPSCIARANCLPDAL